MLLHRDASLQEITPRSALTAGLVVWFVVDTLLSWLAGVYANVAVNAAILVLLMLPVLMTRQLLMTRQRTS